MSFKVGYFWAIGVLPKTELVLAESMGAEDFFVLFVPDEGADLAFSIDCVDEFAGLDVPESHGLIVGSTAGCQKISLPWAPS